MEENLQRRTIMNNAVIENNLTLGGCLPLLRGFIHVHYHYFQTSSSLKLLGQSMPNFMWTLFGKGEGKFL